MNSTYIDSLIGWAGRRRMAEAPRTNIQAPRKSEFPKSEIRKKSEARSPKRAECEPRTCTDKTRTESHTKVTKATKVGVAVTDCYGLLRIVTPQKKKFSPLPDQPPTKGKAKFRMRQCEPRSHTDQTQTDSNTKGTKATKVGVE